MDALFYKDTMYGGGGAMRGNYFNPIIYSTEEREVGVWKDGKPLYQKTLTKTVSSNVDSINVSTLDIDGVHKIEGYTYNSNNGYSIPIAMWQSNSGYAFAEFDKPNESIYIGLANGWMIYNNFVITIQYTKTTDTAGSGKYNTLGVPNVHYTTDEQVIGTWLDGKTLYQRTFDLSNTTFTDNSWNNNILGTNGSGISIKEYDGYFGLSGYDSIFKFEYFRATGEYFTAFTNGDASDLNVRPNMNAGVSVKGNTVTIKYTKTS